MNILKPELWTQPMQGFLQKLKSVFFNGIFVIQITMRNAFNDEIPF